MTYALGRQVEYYDMPAIRAIVRDAARRTTRCRRSCLGVVESPAFRMSRPVAADRDRRAGEQIDDVHHQEHLSRRTVLKGLGVTLALPLLDAMVPAGGA